LHCVSPWHKTKTVLTKRSHFELPPKNCMQNFTSTLAAAAHWQSHPFAAAAQDRSETLR